MNTLKKASCLIILSFILLHFNTSAQELGKYIEQYEGQIGAHTFTVKILRFGEKSNEEILLQVSGVDDPLDGKIYKYKKEWQSSEKRFNKYKYVTTQVPGKERFSTFHSDTSYGSQVFKIYLVDSPMDAIEIYPSSYQENLDPNFMYEQYIQQQKEENNK